jgi:heterodisulfide reductase subunit A
MQAGGAAGAALSLIDQEVVYLDPSIARIEPVLCSGCGQCIEACPYAAIYRVDGYVEVDSTLCKGCGSCAGACPPKAVTLINFRDRQLIAEIAGVLQ